MAQTVEISLRIPSLRVRRDGKDEGKDGMETIANSEVRFSKQVEMASIPKPGEVLNMSVRPDGAFTCDVVSSHWHEEKNMFVIACRYSRRSISAAEYQALVDASDWQMKTLL